MSTSQNSGLGPFFPLQSVSSFVREAVVLVLRSAAALSESDDMFAHGLESLKCMELGKSLRSGLQDTTGSLDKSWITSQVIYEHPSIEKLSSLLQEFVNTSKLPKRRSDRDRNHRAAKRQAMVEKFTGSLPSQQPSLNVIPTSHLHVALTGSTGASGTEMLGRFVKDPQISRIFCMNRSPDAQQRQVNTLSKRFRTADQELKKITYLTVDLSVPRLGLTV